MQADKDQALIISTDLEWHSWIHRYIIQDCKTLERELSRLWRYRSCKQTQTKQRIDQMKTYSFLADITTKYSGPGQKKLTVSYYRTDPNVPALTISTIDNEPLLTASVNLHEAHPRENAIFIKNWSENEGIQSALEKADLIGPPIAHHATGFVVATEHMMKNQLLAAWLNFKVGE